MKKSEKKKKFVKKYKKSLKIKLNKNFYSIEIGERKLKVPFELLKYNHK